MRNNTENFIYYITSGMIATQGMPPRQLRGKRVELQWLDTLSGTWTKKSRGISDRGPAYGSLALLNFRLVYWFSDSRKINN